MQLRAKGNALFSPSHVQHYCPQSQLCLWLQGAFDGPRRSLGPVQSYLFSLCLFCAPASIEASAKEQCSAYLVRSLSCMPMAAESGLTMLSTCVMDWGNVMRQQAINRRGCRRKGGQMSSEPSLGVVQCPADGRDCRSGAKEQPARSCLNRICTLFGCNRLPFLLKKCF